MMEVRVTLLEMLAFCFEKSELLGGWTNRYCPFPTEQQARETFDQWVEELQRWQGPTTVEAQGHERRAAWPGVRMKLAKRSIGLDVKLVGNVYQFWHDMALWEDCGDYWRWEWADEKEEMG